LKEQIAENMKIFIPSHDTVEYAFQELKTPNNVIITENNITHKSITINFLLLWIVAIIGLKICILLQFKNRSIKPVYKLKKII
jgi:hypothetical protein